MPTKIEWTDESWNPLKVKGGGYHCTKISEGCKNCYAEDFNRRFGNGVPYDNDPTEFVLDEKVLERPLRWKKPRRVFVCSMCDLFHEQVPLACIKQVYDVMVACPRHTFQVLTKRPERLANIEGPRWRKHIWLGVTVENQRYAAERILALLQIPAAVRFVSFEPLLEPIEIMKYKVDWAIIGAESGLRRRPCKIEWVRDLVKQCDAVGVPVFVKQLSINGKVSKNPADWPEDLRRREYCDEK